MSAVVGERDRLLRHTVPRNINPAQGKALLIDVDPPAFHQNSAGIPTTSSAKFTAMPVGFVGQVLWSITSGGKLIGTTPNERTLLFSDMTADTVKVTATIIYDGQAYIAVKSFYKVTDGRNGESADPADLSPAALAAALEGRITESQLAHDLLSRIDLVDGPASNPSTVQGQIKKETDARVAALTQEAANRVTYVQQYTYSEQEIDQSLSIWAATITSQYKSYADGVGGQAVSAASADVRSYAYSKTAADSALSAMATTLRSEFSTNNGVSVAYLNNYAFSKAETNSAIASATQTLSTTVGQHTTTLQTQAQSIDGLAGQYTVKIDNNGYVTGFGLASTLNNGTPTSAFIVNAGAFSVVAPGGLPQPMFTVGQVNGQTTAVIRGTLIADDSIIQSKLVVGGSPDNILPDPDVSDLSWWGMTGLATAVDYSAANVGWKSRRALHFENRPFIDVLSKEFAITPGTEYYSEYQSYLSPDFIGNISVYLYLTGYMWNDMGGPSRGYNWGETGLQMDFDGNSPKGFFTWGKSFFNGSSTIQSKALIRITAQVFSGYAEIGGVSITRVADGTLIGSGVVETKHLIIDKGGAIHSGQTGFDLGEGFWLEGANADHGARMSLGSSSGAKIIADPRRGIFGLFNFAITNPNLTLAPFSVNAGGDFDGGYANGGVRTLFTTTAQVTGGRAPFTYVWSQNADTVGFQIVNGTTATVTVKAGGRDSITSGTIVVTVTDANGAVATDVIHATATFGNPVTEPVS